MVSIAPNVQEAVQAQTARDSMLARIQGQSQSFNLAQVSSATEVGADASEGFSNDFDFAAYGRDKDLETGANDGYTADIGREMAVEQQPSMAMGIDLDKLGQLQAMGVPNEVIMNSRGQINEMSVQEMADNFRDSGEISQEAAAAKDVQTDQMQELAAQFQKSMAMGSGETAQDGISASMAGLGQSAGMARAMLG